MQINNNNNNCSRGLKGSGSYATPALYTSLHCITRTRMHHRIEKARRRLHDVHATRQGGLLLEGRLLLARVLGRLLGLTLWHRHRLRRRIRVRIVVRFVIGVGLRHHKIEFLSFGTPRPLAGRLYIISHIYIFIYIYREREREREYI